MRSVFFAFSLLVTNHCEAFTVTVPSPQRHGPQQSQQGGCHTATNCLQSTVRSSVESTEGTTTIRSYEYDGWKLTYRYKPASLGHDQDDPVLLVHPVGIGMSSWFWETFFDEWVGGPLYAPDLIGCGIRNGGDAWNPDKRGLSFPLGWAKGCEALFHIMQEENRTCIVVAQGGLAPVGLMIASRNPEAVSKLVLTSPPTWKDMVTPIPDKELQTNYNFLRNPVWGKLAFTVLESRWAIEFFSNLFLFQDKCDSRWLDWTCSESSVEEARPPVMAFNAGFCIQRSFEEELTGLRQPTLILQGKDDATRIRDDYVSQMSTCSLQTLPGKNVLPWECPKEVCQAIQDFTDK
jgi:pimeloyl-ACP methyl ester carboxylesterase